MGCGASSPQRPIGDACQRIAVTVATHEVAAEAVVAAGTRESSVKESKLIPLEQPDDQIQPSPVDSVLGSGADASLLEHMLTMLPPESVLELAPVSRIFAAASVSDAVWNVFCLRLWADKVYVPSRFRERGTMSRVAAYHGSLRDAQRTAITEEELCSFVWSHRMKGHAGGSWISDDPWHRGEDDIDVRRFHADGTTSGTRNAVAVQGRWHFVPESSGTVGPPGSFVRTRRGERSFPTHFVARWPPNWGFVLNQCWSIATSFPMPPKGEEPALEDGEALCRSVSVERCYAEAWLYQHGHALPFDEELMVPGSGWVELGYDQQLGELTRAVLAHEGALVDTADTDSGEEEEEEEEEEHEEEAVDTAEPELVEEGKPCTSTAYSSSDDNERERDVGSHHNYWHPSNQTPPTLPPSRPTII